MTRDEMRFLKGALGERIGKRIVVGVRGGDSFEKDKKTDDLDFIGRGGRGFPAGLWAAQVKAQALYPPDTSIGLVTGVRLRDDIKLRKAIAEGVQQILMVVDEVAASCYWAPYARLLEGGVEIMCSGRSREWPFHRDNFGNPKRRELMFPIDEIARLGGVEPLLEEECLELFRLRTPESGSGCRRLLEIEIERATIAAIRRMKIERESQGELFALA